MQQLKWLKSHDADLVEQLGQLVAIPSISTDGEHQKELDHSAEMTCALMRQAGLQNVETLRTGDSNPYAYGEWLKAELREGDVVLLKASRGVGLERALNLRED